MWPCHGGVAKTGSFSDEFIRPSITGYVVVTNHIKHKERKMKKTLFIVTLAAVLALTFAAPSLAGDALGPDFKNRKTESRDDR